MCFKQFSVDVLKVSAFEAGGWTQGLFFYDPQLAFENVLVFKIVREWNLFRYFYFAAVVILLIS